MNTYECSVERGNAFVYLDLPDAESHLLKTELVCLVADIIRQRRTTQAETARTLRLSRPDLTCPVCFGATIGRIRWSTFFVS